MSQFDVYERAIEPASPGPSRERQRPLNEPSRLGSQSTAPVAPDLGVLDPEPLQQADRLGEVARGDLDIVPARPQVLDHGAHHEHVG